MEINANMVESSVKGFLSLQESLSVVGVLLILIALLMYQIKANAKKYSQSLKDEKAEAKEALDKREAYFESRLKQASENKEAIALISKQFEISNELLKFQQENAKELNAKLISTLNDNTKGIEKLENKIDMHLVKIESIFKDR